MVLSLSTHPLFGSKHNKRIGVFLINGNTRRGDGTPESHSSHSDRERRQLEFRHSHVRWSPQTHDILVIAIKKDPSSPVKLDVGDEVIVEPPLSAPKPSMRKGLRDQRLPEPTPISPGLPTQDEDYVVHLTSTSRPEEEK